MPHSKQKIKKSFVATFFLGILFCLAFFTYRFGCFVRYFFNIPCPTCGMTRAILSLIKLNIDSYFHYNAFALPVLLSIVVLFFFKHFIKPIIFISIFILMLNFIYYLYRLSYNAIP